MRNVLCLVLAGIFIAACRGPEARRFDIRGEVLSTDATRGEVMLKHEDIKGYMSGMTMPFKVKDAEMLARFAAGDLVTGTLVVAGNDAWIENLTKVGRVEGSAAAQPAPPAPDAASGFELLEPGDPAPRATFTTQDGDALDFAASRGKAVALTFIYTRCPLPTFCPMMDRQFVAIQRQVKRTPDLRDKVQLYSISFDPAYDTPAVLKKHAESLGADPAIWDFLTGDRDEIDKFAAQFGVEVNRDPADATNITHRLRTVVIDGKGVIVRIYQGNEWTPDQVVTDLKSAASGD